VRAGLEEAWGNPMSIFASRVFKGASGSHGAEHRNAAGTFFESLG